MTFEVVQPRQQDYGKMFQVHSRTRCDALSTIESGIDLAISTRILLFRFLHHTIVVSTQGNHCRMLIKPIAVLCLQHLTSVCEAHFTMLLQPPVLLLYFPDMTLVFSGVFQSY